MISGGGGGNKKKKNFMVRPIAGKDEENPDYSHWWEKCKNGVSTLEMFGISHKMKYVLIIQHITVRPREMISRFTQNPVHMCSQQFYL